MFRSNLVLAASSIFSTLALTLACADAESSATDASVDGVEQAVAESDFLYLRCNATSWNLDDQSRLAPLGYSDLALTYNVSADWMRTGGDTCSFMTTNAKNGWGSQQKYYDTTFSGVGQPSTLGAEATSQKDFSVRYPVLGRYQATVRKYDDSLKIALAMLPARQQAVIGTPVTFGVEATGADLTYRWQTKYENEPESAWTDVPGATAPNAQITTGGASMFCQQVRAVVSTPSGVIESASGLLVNQLPPPVFSQDLPTQLTVQEGSSATLTVSAAPASFYVWKRNGSSVEGGSYSVNTYKTPALTLADDGAEYSVEAVRYAGNHQCTRHGVATSRTVRIHVVPR
jgi:hypothetical protein